MHTAVRYHDFCYGHRVHGQGGKCERFHGHNGRVTFHCRPTKGLDSVGRVIDFSDVKTRLCNWLEENWDHKFLLWDQDSEFLGIKELDPSVVLVPFNPTAENLAEWLVMMVGPDRLKGTGIELFKVEFEETRKCSATYELGVPA
jgi:6-pyruvoyltetrahydropterin/6-carboxytetrahydropterin synthase